MFNLDKDPSAVPVTAAQTAYLIRLIRKHGKPAYQASKIKVDIPVETTLFRLSKNQAARLIRELIVNRGRR